MADKTPQSAEEIGEALGVVVSDALVTAAIELSAQRVLDVGGVDYEPSVILNQGQRLASLEAYAVQPHRARGEIKTASRESFCALVTAHSAHHEHPARIYYNEAGGMKAVLNDHHDEPGWCDHVITLIPALHESFAAWKHINGTYKAQLDMAEFIEERIQDFVDPTGAAMLELAQKFEVVRSGSFTSAIRLSTGSTALTIEETTTGKMDLIIPERVVLGMRVFDDENAYQFPAWFRYRVRERALSFCFKIENIERVQKQAVTDMVLEAREALPNHEFFQGTLGPVSAL